MNITLRKATEVDAALLIELYNAAFYADYLRYGECPAYGRTPEQMEQSIRQYPKLIAYAENEAVGVISYRDCGEGEYCIGCLCVIPKYQGRGIGTRLFGQLYEGTPGLRAVSLVTPADKTENIRFYTEKCGCRITGTHMDGGVSVVELRREIKTAQED